jgi:hypothetical protein
MIAPLQFRAKSGSARPGARPGGRGGRGRQSRQGDQSGQSWQGGRPRIVLALAVLLAASCSSEIESSSPETPTTPVTPVTTTGDSTPSTTNDSGSPTEPDEDLDGQAVPLEGEELIAPDPYEPATQVEALLLDGEEKGVDAQFAAEYFNLAFGDMPGATEPYVEGLEAGEASPERAVALAERFGEDLTPDQQRRVAQVVAERQSEGVSIEGAPAGTPHPTEIELGAAQDTPPTSAPGFRSSPSRQAPSQSLIDAFRAVMVGERDRMARLVPNVRFNEITVDLTTKSHTTKQGAHAYATADLVGQTCAITVYPELWRRISELGAVFVDSVITHELFHCAQFVWANGKLYSPDWLIEGSADFAEQDLWRAKIDGGFIRNEWFTQQSKPLAVRDYDAWGLYESIKSSGYNPYTVIEAMVRAKSSETEPTLRAGGLDSGVLAADWGTRSARPLSWTDRRWSMSHPASATSGVNDNFKPVGGTLGVGSVAVQGSARWSHKVQVLSYGSAAQLVRVTNRGKVIAAVTNQKVTYFIGVGETVKLCLDPAVCVCPPDTDTDFVPFGSRKVPVAFQAGADAGLLSVQATKWDKKKDCEPARHRGSSDGDPHLITFDGVAYDLMSVGEFVLARSAKGGGGAEGAEDSFEVQIRTRPAVAGTMPFSLTTAVAVAVGDERVTFTAPDFTSTTDEIVIRSNGSPVEIGAAGGSERAALEVGRDGDRFSLRSGAVEVGLLWDDGFFVDVGAGADVATEGLLGAADRDPFNDLVTAKGDEVLPTDWDTVHGGFADRWRVTEATSLFDYGDGESTATFTDKDYPGAFDELDASGVAEARAECHQRMGRAASSVQLDQCAFDMVASGSDSYVDSYVEVAADRALVDSGGSQEESEDLPDRPTTTLEPGAAPGAAGEPTVVISGVLANLADPAPPESAEWELSETIEVRAGAVLMVRTECRADQELGIELADQSGALTTAVVCGTASGLGGVPDDNDEVRSGEFYWWLPKGGTYKVTAADLTSTGGESRETRVELFTDAEVAVGEAGDLAGGWSGEFDGAGEVAWVELGGVAELRPFAVEGSGSLCVHLLQARLEGDEAPVLLGVCDQPAATETALASPDTGNVMLVFSREGPAEFSIKG